MGLASVGDRVTIRCSPGSRFHGRTVVIKRVRRRKGSYRVDYGVEVEGDELTVWKGIKWFEEDEIVSKAPEKKEG